MEFKKLIKGRVLYTEKDKIWIAKGMKFFAINENGEKISKVYKVGNFKSNVIASFRLSRQLLREGIHHLIPLDNGWFIVCVKRKLYTLDENGKVLSVFEGYNGNKPGHQGICLTNNGTIFFGEYSLNSDRKLESKIYRSLDNGITFKCCLTLSGNEVRHIHFIKYDKFEDCIYMGTGDENFECKLYQSSDNGDTWEVIGEGSQLWRAIGLCITPDNLIWGTDAGSVPDKNYILKYDKKQKEIETLGEVEGPCHGCATFSNNDIYISIGVEGGINELDKYAHLKKIDNYKILEKLKIKKDVFPYLLQFGVMRFPLGTENFSKVIFTCYGLKKHGEVVLIER